MVQPLTSNTTLYKKMILAMVLYLMMTILVRWVVDSGANETSDLEDP